ncbi:MAG: serpin family protein [Planctomycetes bacterium]|nr:serpin family protein [Planctomycetota bacterium]
MTAATHHLAAFVWLATLQILPAQAPPTPAAPPEQALASALNAFAADLHHQLAARGEPVCSPISVSLALLAMLPGARGATADEIAEALHLPEDLRGDALGAAAERLIARAGMRSHAGEAPNRDNPELRLQNDFWSQPGFELLSAYSTALQDCFGAALHQVDFAADTERARREINDTIRDATAGHITELLPEGSLQARTRHLMTSALWLRARWAHEFERKQEPVPFHVTATRTVQTPMMRRTDWLAYAECDAWQAVRLPMKGETLEFEIVLPRAGQSLDVAERALLQDRPRAAATTRGVLVTMPPFTVRGEHRLRASLQALGVRAAFSNEADFTGIDPVMPVSFEDVLHRTWIQVDHEGVEAAAATGAVGVGGPEGPISEPVPFFADRPFAFALRDVRTGLLLFLGRVFDPSRGP